jgi:hypothetical protein
VATFTVSNKKSRRYNFGDSSRPTAHLVGGIILQTHTILGGIHLFVAGEAEQLLDSLRTDSLGARGIDTLFMLIANTST